MPFAVELSGLFGVFMVLVGAWGLLAPLRLTELIQRFATKSGLFVAVAIRLLLGLLLWFAAPQSRAPLLLQVLALLAVLAAVTLPFVGVDRYKALIEWWTRLSTGNQRLWSLLAVLFGATILWALLPTAT
ncbi:MAG: hypothetical protein AMJ62_00040 [Myxococcales bacterium SG8_38]|nr:MAG: hypothetical protein AMJ62_00040 [Myxococcales bacterium SG8_38]